MSSPHYGANYRGTEHTVYYPNSYTACTLRHRGGALTGTGQEPTNGAGTRQGTREGCGVRHDALGTSMVD